MGISTFCSVLSAVVKLNGFDVVSSSFVIGENEALVDGLVGSVIGLLLVALAVLGRVVVLRVTTVDLTVEALFVGLPVVNEGFVRAVVLFFSSDSTENVVTNMSSADKVVGSTFTIKSVGVGRGRGAFVVSTKEIVVNTAGVVDTLGNVEILEGDDDGWVGFLVVLVVAFLREEIVVLRFTVKIVDATGFLVVFITVDVVFFDGFNVVTGRLVGLTVLDISDETDVRLSACKTGFLVELVTGFLVL